MIGFAYFSRAECLGEVQDLFEVFRPDVSMSRSSQTAPSSALIDALPKPCQSPDLRRKYMEMLQMTSERSERSKPSPIWTFQTFEPSQGDIQGYSGWIIGVFLVFLPLGRGATPTPCSTQRPHSLEGKRLRTTNWLSALVHRCLVHWNVLDAGGFILSMISAESCPVFPT